MGDHKYALEPPPFDPHEAAKEMLRLFGEGAEEMASYRSAMFLASGDMHRGREWLLVKACIADLTWAAKRPEGPLN